MFKMSADMYRITRVNDIPVVQGMRFDALHNAYRVKWGVFIPDTGDVRIVYRVTNALVRWYAVDSKGDVITKLYDDIFSVSTAMSDMMESIAHYMELCEGMANIGAMSWGAYSDASWDGFSLYQLALNVGR